MKKWYFILIYILIARVAKADHITGGEMYYTYTGFSNGLHQYNVTLKFYMRCSSGRNFNNPTIVSVFNKTNNARFTDISVPLTDRQTISITTPDPCITNPPPVCYEVGYYNFNVSLPSSAQGFVLASQANFRISGISNLTPGYAQIGATYTAEIPGTTVVENGSENNSARFVGSDLVVVCANNNFNYSFAAEDADGDQLRYSLCNAYRSSVTTGGNVPNPTLPPPFNEVPYSSIYSGSTPLGAPKINTTTGLISGIAPNAGIYIVTVCVEEIRNGKVIATQRKDLQLNIAPCTVAGALLEEDYMLCRNSKTLTVRNLSTSTLIQTQDWEILDQNNRIIHTFNGNVLNYTFTDIGKYFVKLVINRNGSCKDSSTSPVFVFPGFKPDFRVEGICFKRPTEFKDATTTVYGAVNGWKWNLDEGNVSTLQNPTATYNTMGTKTIELIAYNSNGCRDTVLKTIEIIDKPDLRLAFKDSLICSADVVQLKAEGRGNFSWTPNASLTNSNTATPVASPKITTKYFVTLNDNGCITTDTVNISVVDAVQLQAMPDTTICQSDSIRLRIVSDAFTYNWTPASQLNDPKAKNPIAGATASTRYEVKANIGSCSATASIFVKTVPYPTISAGTDTTICFDTQAKLSGTTDANSVTWSPGSTLSNSRIINPIARPLKTTSYVLSVTDNKGCPKPVRDTVIVNVLEDIEAYAGRDTAVIIGQPLQLNGSNGAAFEWSPSYGLSATDIRNPVALFQEGSEGIRYKLIIYNEDGCADSAYINIKIFSTKATIFVPSAFTPNGDARNDVIRPIAVGIKQIEFFRIYNRWGQLVFSTTINGQGWDGRINGQLQGNNVYVWEVKAVDYDGKPFFKKGLVTLIR